MKFKHIHNSTKIIFILAVMNIFIDIIKGYYFDLLLQIVIIALLIVISNYEILMGNINENTPKSIE